MPATRRSTRLTSSQDSSPPQQKESPKAATGAKRKSEATPSPAAKRGKKNALAEQKTIEETMDVDATDEPNVETKADGHSNGTDHSQVESDQSKPAQAASTSKEQKSTEEPTKQNGAKSEDQPTQQNGDKSSDASPNSAPKTNNNDAQSETQTSDKSETKPSEKTPKQSESKSEQDTKQDSQSQPDDKEKPKHEAAQDKSTSNGDSAVEAHARDDEVPSSILEKGIIYFFMKGRIGIDHPSEPDDVARSYIVLRPIPHGAKIGDGAISSAEGKCRLLALPKKVLPVSGNDKFMIFVENAKTSFEELKESFLSASDYDTKTAGDRHTPAATPLAEGVYAITTTGRESHLAYMLTLPTELGDVQKDMGLREQGSFVTSVKNPKYSGPANATLPQGPEFPQEVIDKFRNLRWAPLEPEFLNYENTQFLLIGESSGIDKALQSDNKDEANNDMKVEMEKLEGEDEIRIKHLEGNDAIFADLGTSKKDYPKVQTTWQS